MAENVHIHVRNIFQMAFVATAIRRAERAVDDVADQSAPEFFFFFLFFCDTPGLASSSDFSSAIRLRVVFSAIASRFLCGAWLVHARGVYGAGGLGVSLFFFFFFFFFFFSVLFSLFHVVRCDQLRCALLCTLQSA